MGARALRFGCGSQEVSEVDGAARGGRAVECVDPNGRTGVVVGRRWLMGAAEKVPGTVKAPCGCKSASVRASAGNAEK